MEGNITKIMVLIRSDMMKGMTPLNVSASDVVLAIALITNRFMPTGGVISPTSTTISTNTPNQMANSSGARPKSSTETIGKNIGIVNNIIDNESITQPNII